MRLAEGMRNAPTEGNITIPSVAFARYEANCRLNSHVLDSDRQLVDVHFRAIHGLGSRCRHWQARIGIHGHQKAANLQPCHNLKVLIGCGILPSRDLATHPFAFTGSPFAGGFHLTGALRVAITWVAQANLVDVFDHRRATARRGIGAVAAEDGATRSVSGSVEALIIIHV
jgi:hypothetical protein